MDVLIVVRLRSCEYDQKYTSSFPQANEKRRNHISPARLIVACSNLPFPPNVESSKRQGTFKECQTAIYTLPIFWLFVEKVLCLRFHVIGFFCFLSFSLRLRDGCSWPTQFMQCDGISLTGKQIWRKCDWSVSDLSHGRSVGIVKDIETHATLRGLDNALLRF